jgi:hypothetical protein
VAAITGVHLQDSDENVDVGNSDDNHCEHYDGTRSK